MALVVLIAVGGFFAFGIWFATGDSRAVARANMRSTLRNLTHAESVYFARHHTFTDSVPVLDTIGGSRDTTSSGAWDRVHRRYRKTVSFTPAFSGEVHLTIEVVGSTEWRAH